MVFNSSGWNGDWYDMNNDGRVHWCVCESTQDNNQQQTSSAYGGTETSYADYTVHTFLSSGTFTVTSSITVDLLIVAGGGGGASGGGGAGGVLQITNYALSAGTAIPVVVGSGGTAGTGGAGSSGANIGGNGGNSSFGDITAIGGGGGGNTQVNGGRGADGGSGGGGSYDRPNVEYSNGTSEQGNRGGRSDRPGYGAGGGGGGGGDV